MFDNEGVVLLSLLCFIGLYLCLAPCFDTSKQRSWILTGLSSAFTSAAAMSYFFDFLVSGGHVHAIRPAGPWSDTVVRIFQGYLISDLLVGSICYRRHITLATGWIHHTLYLALIQYITSVGWSNIFCLALIMEIPTTLLALGSLHPRWRNDYLFVGAFFSTRISLHVALIVAYAGVYFRKAVPKSLDSPLPALFFLAAFPMHCMWFAGCVRGILRRRVKASNDQSGCTRCACFDICLPHTVSSDTGPFTLGPRVP
ncbi:TLC domain protein [Rhizoctonia solani AG-3 Rhs1AP]|uniref:TLC domain protein n=1 Tax=Rhizoctonia solani AG-3 Rhs1AP TaxID=1086054 RepID=X8J4K6_9AGAM|nr:TLC domain protein [Rhizoctonia solani AG-3 Rhs1AP]